MEGVGWLASFPGAQVLPPPLCTLHLVLDSEVGGVWDQGYQEKPNVLFVHSFRLLSFRLLLFE